MINKELVEEGRKNLEGVLNRETSAVSDFREKEINRFYEIFMSGGVLTSLPREETTHESVKEILQRDGRLIYLRTNGKRLIGRGKHQVVIDVGNDLVAKISYKKREYPNFIRIGSPPCQFIHETRETLNEIGIEVPEMYFYRVEWDNNQIIVSSEINHGSYGEQLRKLRTPIEEWSEEDPLDPLPNIYLTPDLRENGRYEVVGYINEYLRKLPNRDLIYKYYQETYSKLFSLYQNLEQDEELNGGEPFLLNSGHKEHSIEKAIRKMFLLQIPKNPGEDGKLVVGDIDHIFIFN